LASGGAASTNWVSSPSSSDRSGPPAFGELGDGEIDELGVLRTHHALDPQHLPHEHERPPRWIGDLAPHLVPHRGIAQPLLPVGRRQGQRRPEALHLVEQERRAEREVRPLPVGCEHRIHAHALLGGLGRELEAALPPVRRVGHPGERVHVDGGTRRASHREDELSVGIVVPVEERARDELDRAVIELRQHGGERDDLLGIGVVGRDTASVVGDVQLELRRREPARAFAERLPDQLLHRADLVAGRGPLGRVVAHHVTTDRAVSDVRAHVHPDVPFEAVEELAEPTARERDPLGQGFRRHALDPAEHLGEPGEVLGLRGGEREAAVADEDRRDPVPRRGGRRRVPVQLRVVVRVDVDEARRHGQAVGIELFGAPLVDPTDLGDAPVAHGDVGREGGQARPVDDPPAPDDEVEAHCGATSDRSGTAIPYIASAFRPNSPSRSAPVSDAFSSRSSSTTPGYLASL
jgi:hypothetical protein